MLRCNVALGFLVGLLCLWWVADNAVLLRTEATQIGVLYEGWHGYAAWAMSQVAAMGGQQLSIEQVIRSNGQYLITDIFDKYGVQNDAAGFLYQATPQLGFYCIYEKRPGQSSGPIPDCPNINHTTLQQAQWLTSAGVDYVLIDSTNLPTFDNFSDVIQVRPTEILFEQWYNLRQQNISTPQIAVWPTVPTGSNIWQMYLDELYNNPLYDDLVLTDPATGKKVFFVVDSGEADPNIISTIESNGGLNNIAVVRMWAEFDPSEFSTGKWGFFSPCTAGGEYTTSIYGPNGLAPCNQYYTTNSPIGASGTAVSVSPSYQLQYGSVPFQSPGKFLGQTFKLQWDLAFQVQPDYIFISSWNEFIAQPQPDPWQSTINTAYDMGLENDPSRYGLFVDSYGVEFSRDIEPTVEGGSVIYDILASCIRVYRSGATTCSDPSEECCNLITDASVEFNNIWSYRLPNNGDFILSNSAAEVGYLPGDGYVQNCNAFTGPSTFCVDSSLTAAQSGPFMIFASAVGGNSTGLYRCMEGGVTHFFSTDPNCEGQKTEYQLGWISTVKSTLTPRSLRRCIYSNGVHFHSLDIECPPGSTTEALYGYVR